MKQIFQIRTVYILCLLVFVSAIAFSVFYYTAGSDQLSNWFFGLNDCIYRKNAWRSEFFTPQVKQAGDRLCIYASLISLVGIIYVARRLRKKKSGNISYSISRNDKIWFSIVTLMGLGLWIYSNSLIRPSYDEIFSAVNAAGIHPFQTLSYYMLPNNHIFFNLINNLVFHPFDKVVTGRIISLVAYIGMLIVVFRWFRWFIPYRLLALISTFLVAIQFTTLGFASQARGYELQLLSGWVALVSLLKYYNDGKKHWLRWNALACIIGYITIPSFLFFHAALLLFIFLKQVYEHKADFLLWKYQLICFCSVFFFYLPALCFSGVSAFAENRYVSSVGGTWEEFVPDFIVKFKYFVNYGFSFMLGENNRINYLMFLLPVSLIFSRNRNVKLAGVFYVLLWGVFTVLVLYMKRFPFCRNLIIHYSITQAFVVLALFSFIQFIADKLRLKLITYILFPVTAVLLSIHYLTAYKENFEFLLYFNHVNEIYKLNDEGINTIPEGSSIGFSDESFYWYYYCNKRNYKLNRCPDGTESFYVKRPSESLPELFEVKYQLLTSLPEDYEVYVTR